VIDAIRENRVDIGIVAIHEGLKDITKDLEFKPLIKGEMKVYVNKNSPLAIYDTITSRELVNQTSNIKMLHMINHEAVKVEFGFVYSKKGPLSAASAKFIKYVEKEFQSKTFI
jgi:hypothetical protein